MRELILSFQQVNAGDHDVTLSCDRILRHLETDRIDDALSEWHDLLFSRTNWCPKASSLAVEINREFDAALLAMGHMPPRPLKNSDLVELIGHEKQGIRYQIAFSHGARLTLIFLLLITFGVLAALFHAAIDHDAAWWVDAALLGAMLYLAVAIWYSIRAPFAEVKKGLIKLLDSLIR